MLPLSFFLWRSRFTSNVRCLRWDTQHYRPRLTYWWKLLIPNLGQFTFWNQLLQYWGTLVLVWTSFTILMRKLVTYLELKSVSWEKLGRHKKKLQNIKFLNIYEVVGGEGVNNYHEEIRLVLWFWFWSLLLEMSCFNGCQEMEKIN